MSPVFLLLPGIARWELVDLDGGPARPLGNRLSSPLISGSMPTGPEPAAVAASNGTTHPTQNREPRT